MIRSSVGQIIHRLPLLLLLVLESALNLDLRRYHSLHIQGAAFVGTPGLLLISEGWLGGVSLLKLEQLRRAARHCIDCLAALPVRVIRWL